MVKYNSRFRGGIEEQLVKIAGYSTTEIDVKRALEMSKGWGVVSASSGLEDVFTSNKWRKNVESAEIRDDNSTIFFHLKGGDFVEVEKPMGKVAKTTELQKFDLNMVDNDKTIREIEEKSYGVKTYKRADDEAQPDDGDAFFTSTGNLGSMTSVSVDGKFLGEYNSEEEAEKALKDWMKKNKFSPNVWTVSDHGNVEPRTLEAEKEAGQDLDNSSEVTTMGLGTEDTEPKDDCKLDDLKFVGEKKSVEDKIKEDISIWKEVLVQPETEKCPGIKELCERKIKELGEKIKGEKKADTPIDNNTDDLEYRGIRIKEKEGKYIIQGKGEKGEYNSKGDAERAIDKWMETGKVAEVKESSSVVTVKESAKIEVKEKEMGVDPSKVVEVPNKEDLGGKDAVVEDGGKNEKPTLKDVEKDINLIDKEVKDVKKDIKELKNEDEINNTKVVDNKEKSKDKEDTTVDKKVEETKAEKKAEEGYQGHANHSTWACSLWIDNDGIGEEIRRLVEEGDLESDQAVGDYIKNYVEENKPELGNNMYADILNANLSEINYKEIAKDIWDGAEKPSKDEEEK